METNDNKIETPDVNLDAELNAQQEDFTAGDVRKAHREQRSDESDLLMDMIMADACGGDQCSKSFRIIGKDKKTYGVQFLADNLPAVQFVSQFYLELIMHGGIEARNKSYQAKLDKWILSKNYVGQTHGNVIREALHSSIIYGYSGLRKVGSSVHFVPPQNFKIWMAPALMDGRPIPGVKAPIVYQINPKEDYGIEDKEETPAAFNGKNYTLKQLIEEREWVEGVDGSLFADDDYDGANTNVVFVDADNFCHLRHSDEGTYGRSPLTKDRIRTTMFVDYGMNVIDEIGNDGTDYMMYLKPRNAAGVSLTSMISSQSANTAIQSGVDQKQVKSASEKQMEVARTLAKKLKRTNKTRFAIISMDWVERIEKLEGTVHLPEYLPVLNDAKGVVADIYGIPALLAGSSGGGWSTGMSALIPFTLERTIKPFQQRYAEQLSDIISECAGISGGIRFKEIDWTDIQTQTEIDKIRSEIELNLAKAESQKVTDKKTEKETKLMTKNTVNSTSTNQKATSK